MLDQCYVNCVYGALRTLVQGGDSHHLVEEIEVKQVRYAKLESDEPASSIVRVQSGFPVCFCGCRILPVLLRLATLAAGRTG